MWAHFNKEYMEPLQQEIAALEDSGIEPKKLEALIHTFCQMKGYALFMADHESKEACRQVPKQ